MGDVFCKAKKAKRLFCLQYKILLSRKELRRCVARIRSSLFRTMRKKSVPQNSLSPTKNLHIRTKRKQSAPQNFLSPIKNLHIRTKRKQSALQNSSSPPKNLHIRTKKKK